MNEVPSIMQEELVIDEQTLPIIEQLSEHMPGGFFIYHADGDEELIFVNRSMLRIFGCDTMEQFKELTGFTFPGLVHPEDVERVEETIKEQIAGSPDDLDYVEYRIVRADGEIRWIMDYGHFVHTETMGDLFYVFISDSTEMVLEVQEHKRQAEVIMGLAYDHETIMLLDLERYEVIPYAIGPASSTPVGEDTTGVEAVSAAFAEYAEKYVWEQDRPMFLASVDLSNIEELLKHETHFAMNFHITDDNGDAQWLRLDIADIEDENRYTRVVMGIKTVTRQVELLEKQTEERLKLERERDEALQISSSKSAFLFNMSHDVRTPLNAIIGFSTLARKYLGDPDRASECLDAVDKASDHLLDLIDDVLDMSQIESGSLHIKPQPCSVPSQLKTVVDLLSTSATEHDIEFETVIDVPPVKVMADPLNLRRIFLKIVDNAVKYTLPGGHVKVELLGSESDGDRVDYTFRVADTGVGMSKAFMEHLFESFERENNTTQSGMFGTGLGLSITKSLIDMMDGTVEVESKKGAGSVFTVRLSFESVGEDNSMQSSIGANMDDDISSRFEGKRVLVVEDNELNRIITETIMKEAGVEVESVMDGADAVRAIRSNPPGYYNLVLMDIQMPVMNGYDATRAIRTIDREDIPSLPIVALSANSLEEDKRRSIESGMNGHFAKPINVSSLLGVLGDYMV